MITSFENNLADGAGAIDMDTCLKGNRKSKTWLKSSRLMRFFLTDSYNDVLEVPGPAYLMKSQGLLVTTPLHFVGEKHWES